MPNSQKKNIVDNLHNTLSEYDALVLVDYTGLTHQQLAEIRAKVIEAGGKLQVVKNNLLLIALQKANLPIPDEKLAGPTAVLFVGTNDPSPIKTIYEQGKQTETLGFKWGIWEHDLMDSDTLTRLAMLPGRHELHAYLVGSLRSPQTRMVISLKSTLHKFVIVLNEVRKLKA